MRKPPQKPKSIHKNFNSLERKPKPIRQPNSLKKGLKSLNPALEQEREVKKEKQAEYRSLTTHADHLFELGEVEKALELYKQLITESPKDNYPYKQICRCFRRMAKSYKKKKDYQKVVDLLEEMFEISEEHERNFKAIDYKILGECYMKLGEYEEAREALEDALHLKPDMYSAMELVKELKAEEVSRRLSGLKDLPYESFED